MPNQGDACDSKEFAERIAQARRKIRESVGGYQASEIRRETLDDVLALEEFRSYPDPEAARIALSSIFKSYDIRGVVIPYVDAEGSRIKVNLSREVARRVGRALGSVVFDELPGEVKKLEPGDVFVIGMDNGVTSPRLLDGLATGLTESGVNVVTAGEGPTGAVYEAVQRLGAQGGAIITRSHVEKEYNGIKIVLGREALHSKFIEQIRDAVFSGRARKVSRPAVCIAALEDSIRRTYELALIREFEETLRKGSAPIAVNFGGGTARLYRESLTQILGDRLVKVFRAESDPEARGGLPDPTQPRYLQEQIAWTKDHPDVTLFSFDLDADRVSVMIDGQLYLGDVMAFPLVAYKLEQEHPALMAELERLGGVKDLERADRIARICLTDPRCSKSLNQLVDSVGGRVVQNRIGHSHFKAAINRLMSELAEAAGFPSVPEFVTKTGYAMWQAEYSLHFFGTDEFGVPADDAIRFMLKFIGIMDYFGRKQGRPALTLRDYMAHLHSRGVVTAFVQAPEIRTVYDDKDKVRVVSDMEKAMGREARERGWRMTGMDVLGDGFRLDAPDGFILFRYSNTSPKLTMRIEAADRERWLEYFTLLFTHYNRLRKPEYELDMVENRFLREQFGIGDPGSLGR